MMFYLVIENIRSFWREFQAIHDLHLNQSMAKHVFASDMSLDMALTPPSTSSLLQMTAATATTNNKNWIDWREYGLTEQFAKLFYDKYNSSQLLAIRNSVNQQGFTLIQGPPGTGKTTTIIGILNAIHLREYHTYYHRATAMLLGKEGMTCRNQPSDVPWLQLISKLSKDKPRILIVAPSNVAVDNIILRIMEKGFLDGKGGMYKPCMLRMGSGRSDHVTAVSLDEIINQELGSTAANTRGGMNLHQQVADQAVEIDKKLKELIFVQTMLLNLRTAFNLSSPLPNGWEIRVSIEHAQPYWVDHVNKATSLEPPSRDIFEANRALGMKNYYDSVEQLPEYKSNIHLLTQLLDTIEALHLKRSRLQAVLQLHDSNMARSCNNNSMKRYNEESAGDISHSARLLLENCIIEDTQLLFTTLNSSGHRSLESTEFCVTIIDEAAQCVEPSTLIALRRGCKQCIMVGDQKQLPATIFASHIKPLGYDRSLFERLLLTGHSYIMLDRQYRMCPDISEFPAKTFYDGMLYDGSNVCEMSYVPPYLYSLKAMDLPALRRSHALFNAYIFFNLQSSKDTLTESSLSRVNYEEVRFCMELLKTLIGEIRKYSMANDLTRSAAPIRSGKGPLVDLSAAGAGGGAATVMTKKPQAEKTSIGIITPYAEQLSALVKEFRREGLIPAAAGNRGKRKLGEDSRSSSSESLDLLSYRDNMGEKSVTSFYDLELNTVDGFQGKEKDIIIISTVRSNEEGAIGFLSDTRRMNVALTRGRFGMFVVGNAATLAENKHWGELLHNAHARRVIVDIPHADVDIKPILSAHKADMIHSLQGSAISSIIPAELTYNETNDSQESPVLERKRSLSLEDGEIYEV